MESSCFPEIGKQVLKPCFPKTCSSPDGKFEKKSSLSVRGYWFGDEFLGETLFQAADFIQDSYLTHVDLWEIEMVVFK